MNKLSETLPYIEYLVHQINNQPDDPLYTVIDEGNGFYQLLPTNLANAIIGVIRDQLSPVLEQFPFYVFNPYINVFIKNVVNSNLIETIQQHDALTRQYLQHLTGHELNILLAISAVLKNCLNGIRCDMQTTDFKCMIAEAKRVSQKNHDGLMQLIDSLFEHFYQILVIRLDLTYHEGNTIKSYADIETKYWEANGDFKHLLNNAKKNSLFKHLIKKVWKLEYGPDKGFHYHLILFLDGSKVKQDVYIAEQIGEYWEHSITQSRGSYWNCNGDKHDYWYCALGMIHYSDVEKRKYLKQAAAYLIKIDHFARMLTPDHSKTFAKGKMLPARNGGPGRPRAKT